MTAQIAEVLRYQGEDVAMCSTPLSDWFVQSGIEDAFEVNCTGLWRGYIGRWEIFDGHLYLVGLQGTLKGGSEATLARFFPDATAPVCATWYTGTLRVPEGRLLRYVHMGFGSTFERDLLVDVRGGVVVGPGCRAMGSRMGRGQYRGTARERSRCSVRRKRPQSELN
jgi:hypothetical protein